MVNRVIIRTKVLQIVYSYYQRDEHVLSVAENELAFSLQKTYDLYHYLFLLIPFLTDLEQKRVDLRRHRHLATDAEKAPSLRFINNRFSKQLLENQSLQKFVGEKSWFWDQDDHFGINILNKIVASELYSEYMTSEDSYESDKEFWRKALKSIVLLDLDLEEMLEDKSIYWNDDLDLVGTFVLKTIRKWTDNCSEQDEPLMPMFKDEEDRLFAYNLLHQTIIDASANKQLIESHIKNWDVDRLANMDLYVMQMAIAEMTHFPMIPINVTLNEYIDLAKYYSTPKSGVFINGTLDSIVSDLKKEQVLTKV